VVLFTAGLVTGAVATAVPLLFQATVKVLPPVSTVAGVASVTPATDTIVIAAACRCRWRRR
jgi:hypothetical protein